MFLWDSGLDATIEAILDTLPLDEHLAEFAVAAVVQTAERFCLLFGGVVVPDELATNLVADDSQKFEGQIKD